MRFSLAFVALVASVVSAQSQNYTSSLDMEIDPNTVPQARRASWCTAQTNTCYALCDNDTNENSCAQSTLEYECTCSSNNSAPGLQYYSQTIPTFICQELFSQCNDQNTGSQRGQQACQDDIQDLCAEQDPPTPDSDDDDDDATTTATETETETSTATATESDASATDDSVTSTTSDGFAAPTMAPAGKGAAAAVALGMLAYLV